MRPSVFKLIDAMLKARAAFDGWITLTSRNGDGDKVGGSRVLLDDDGAIVYGLGGGYKPQIIKSGDYEIRGSSGYYRVYHNGKQLSTVSKLSEAKNFAENHSAGSV